MPLLHSAALLRSRELLRSARVPAIMLLAAAALGLIAANSSFSELPPILFDALFSHLTTRTVMLGQGGDAATFRPLIAELIELVVARVERR